VKKKYDKLVLYLKQTVPELKAEEDETKDVIENYTKNVLLEELYPDQNLYTKLVSLYEELSPEMEKGLLVFGCTDYAGCVQNFNGLQEVGFAVKRFGKKVLIVDKERAYEGADIEDMAIRDPNEIIHTKTRKEGIRIIVDEDLGHTTYYILSLRKTIKDEWRRGKWSAIKYERGAKELGYKLNILVPTLVKNGLMDGEYGKYPVFWRDLNDMGRLDFTLFNYPRLTERYFEKEKERIEKIRENRRELINYDSRFMFPIGVGIAWIRMFFPMIVIAERADRYARIYYHTCRYESRAHMIRELICVPTKRSPPTGKRASLESLLKKKNLCFFNRGNSARRAF
jgi:hypothetical protein